MKQLSVEVPNQPGELAKILAILSRHQLDIRALTVAPHPKRPNYGALKMILSDGDAAARVMAQASIPHAVEEVLVVPLEDHPGGLHAVLEILAAEKINVEHVYAFVARREGKALSVLVVDDIARGRALLEAAGVQLLAGAAPSAAASDLLAISWW
jgi:hypothetical protein